MKEIPKKSKVTIKIPRPLYEKISCFIEGEGYNSVTDFIVFVLRDLMAGQAMTTQSGLYSQQWQQLFARLRSLSEKGKGSE